MINCRPQNHFLVQVMLKHLKSWSPCTGVWTPQIISDFPQKFWLRMRKPSNLCAKPVCHFSPDCNQKCPIAFELLRWNNILIVFSQHAASLWGLFVAGAIRAASLPRLTGTAPRSPWGPQVFTSIRPPFIHITQTKHCKNYKIAQTGQKKARLKERLGCFG